MDIDSRGMKTCAGEVGLTREGGRDLYITLNNKELNNNNKKDTAYPFGFSQGHDYSKSLEVCLYFPLHSLCTTTLLITDPSTLPSTDHLFLQSPFLCSHPLWSGLKRLPLHHRKNGGGAQFEPLQLKAGFCSPWASTFPLSEPHLLD